MGQKGRKEMVPAMANSRENRVQNRGESEVSNYTVSMHIWLLQIMHIIYTFVPFRA